MIKIVKNITLEDTSYGDIWGRLSMPERCLQAFFIALKGFLQGSTERKIGEMGKDGQGRGFKVS